MFTDLILHWTLCDKVQVRVFLVIVFSRLLFNDLIHYSNTSLNMMSQDAYNFGLGYF